MNTQSPILPGKVAFVTGASKGIGWVEKLKAMPRGETKLVNGDNASNERAWLDW